jgi:hypothetical protein
MDEGVQLELTYPEEFVAEIQRGNVEAQIKFLLVVDGEAVLGRPPGGLSEFGVTYMNNLLEGVRAAFDGEGHLARFAEGETCLVFQPVTDTDKVVIAEEIFSPRAERMASPRSNIPSSSDEFEILFRWAVTDWCELAAEFTSAATQLHDRIVEVDQSCADHRFLAELEASIDATRRAFEKHCCDSS